MRTRQRTDSPNEGRRVVRNLHRERQAVPRLPNRHSAAHRETAWHHQKSTSQHGSAVPRRSQTTQLKRVTTCHQALGNVTAIALLPINVASVLRIDNNSVRDAYGRDHCGGRHHDSFNSHTAVQPAQVPPLGYFIFLRVSRHETRSAANSSWLRALSLGASPTSNYQKLPS